MGGGKGFGKGKGKGGGKGKGFGKSFDEGPPDSVEKIGLAMHECEDQLVVRCTHKRVPQFNARIFLGNKEHIGHLDEIFGPINDYMFSVKMCQGMNAKSFKADAEVFIDPMKTLDFSRFLPQKPGAGGGKGKGKGKDGKGKGKGKGFGKGDKGKGKGGKGKGGFGGVQKGGQKFVGRGGAAAGGK